MERGTDRERPPRLGLLQAIVAALEVGAPFMTIVMLRHALLLLVAVSSCCSGC